MGFTAYLAVDGPWLGNRARCSNVCEEILPIKREVLIKFINLWIIVSDPPQVGVY